MTDEVGMPLNKTNKQTILFHCIFITFIPLFKFLEGFFLICMFIYFYLFKIIYLFILFFHSFLKWVLYIYSVIYLCRGGLVQKGLLYKIQFSCKFLIITIFMAPRVAGNIGDPLLVN